MPTDNPDVYGSYMNFFLPKSAQVGSSTTQMPGLFDLLGGVSGGLGGSSQPGTPDAQAQQKKQQQNLAIAQQGIKMMYPQQPARPAPSPVPVAPPQPQQPLPQATQVTPDQSPQMQPMPYVTSPGQPSPRMQPMPYVTSPGQPSPRMQPMPYVTQPYDPRDPRRRNPLAGTPTPFGGVYR